MEEKSNVSVGVSRKVKVEIWADKSEIHQELYDELFGVIDRFVEDRDLDVVDVFGVLRLVDLACQDLLNKNVEEDE